MPLPTAADDHQRKNAEALVARGAAAMIEERDRRVSVSHARCELLDDTAGSTHESRDAGTAKPDAAKIIVERCSPCEWVNG